jgi:hypothetical protein
MMDYVYLTKVGFYHELKFSIRSLLHYKPEANIIIVGGKPSWYKGEYYISTYGGNKHRVVKQSLRRIIKNDNVSDDFVLMNEDFFFLNPFDNHPYYTTGTLAQHHKAYVERDIKSHYTHLLNKTDNKLKELGVKKPMSFETHTPIVYNKEKLADSMKHGCMWRSMYCNLHNVVNTYIKQDVKVYDANTYVNRLAFCEQVGLLSSQDTSFGMLYPYLKEKFPEKSRLEAGS